MTRCDVLVAGAGPAGALAAREIARRGARVLLLDRSRFPRTKVCGGCLSAGAVEVLASVGLGDMPATLGAEPIGAFVLSAGSRSARLRLDGGYAVSRSLFDQALLDAAREAGVEWWPGARASLGVVGSGGRLVQVVSSTGHREVEAGVVLDATGLGGALQASSEVRVAADSRVGLGATLHAPEYPVEKGDLHMVVGSAGYVGLVRIEGGALNVAAAVDPFRLKRSTPARAVGEILVSAGMPPLASMDRSDWRGTPTLTRESAEVGGERFFRLGDAAGYVEPFTGEGMCWAMSAARAVAPLAAEAADRWSPDLLRAWAAYHEKSLSRARRLCRVLAPMLRHPRLVAGATALLGVTPSLAGPLVRRAARPPGLAARAA